MARSSHMNDYEQGWSPEGFLWAEDLEAELDKAAELERRAHGDGRRGASDEVAGQEPGGLREDQLEYLSQIVDHIHSASGQALVQLGQRALGHVSVVQQAYARITAGLPLLTAAHSTDEVPDLGASMEWANAVEALALATRSMRHLDLEIRVDLACDGRAPAPAQAPSLVEDFLHSEQTPAQTQAPEQQISQAPQPPQSVTVVQSPAQASETASEPTEVETEPELEPAATEAEPEQQVPSHAQLALAGQIKSRMRARVPVSSIADGLMLRDSGADLDQVADHCRVSTSTVRRWYATAEEIVVDQAAQATQAVIDTDQESTESEPEHLAPQEQEGGAAEDAEPEDAALEPTEAEEAELESMEAELTDIFGDDDDTGSRSSFWDGFDG